MIHVIWHVDRKSRGKPSTYQWTRILKRRRVNGVTLFSFGIWAKGSANNTHVIVSDELSHEKK